MLLKGKFILAELFLLGFFGTLHITLDNFPCLDFYSGWNIRCMDSGSMHHFVGADSSCISWGHAQYGELGFGPTGQKYVFITLDNNFF